jgi:23S rRNA pseudouridine955/2504/2580 synthase
MSTVFNPVQIYTVTEDYSGTRLDNCLLSKMKGIPRSKIYSIIRKGEVRVNKSRCKPSQKLQMGDEVRIPPYSNEHKVTKKAENILKDKLINSIIVKDKKFIIINKPVGIASHGGSGISLGVIEAFRQIDRSYREAQLVHRLDKDTSGCLVIALRKSILREFHKEIREDHVDKDYLAVVKGRWPESIKKVEVSLLKDRLKSGEREVQIDPIGKNSISYFEVMTAKKTLSLVKCRIITGRTHQIRVHATHSGHPIVGDIKYGDKNFNKALKSDINRMMLHAHEIKFKNMKIEATTKVPDVFDKLMKKHD